MIDTTKCLVVSDVECLLTKTLTTKHHGGAMAPEQSEHGSPPEGLECLVTMEDITKDNYVEFQCAPSLKWKPAFMEESVIEELLRSQFHNYIERVKKSDCQAELRRLLESGPPIYIHDPHGLPLEDNDTHVSRLWYASSNAERTAKLDGAVEGEERDKLWEELRQFIVVEGKEEGDDDDDDENEK